MTSLTEIPSMPFVEVYRKGDRVNIEYFRRNFYVVARLSGEIYWHTGEQRESRGGEIKVWVQRADTAPRILGILPDWQLFIDGVRQESKFYDSVENLASKMVELQHKEYRFIFHFA